MQLTVSNIISFVRLLLVAPMAWALWTDRSYTAVGIGVLAYLSDILDGYVARKRGEISELGKVIDPLADKIFVGAAVVVLLLKGSLAWWFAGAILARDLLILIAGIVVSRRMQRVPPSNYTGKAAVVAIGISLLLTVFSVAPWLELASQLLAIFLMVASLGVYGSRMVQQMRLKSPSL